MGFEFIRRFCLHTLPSRYRKIRTLGFLSNASNAKSIPIARKALRVKHDHLLTTAQRKEKAIENLFGNVNIHQCPRCKRGIMQMKIAITRNRPPPKYILEKIKNQKMNKKSR